MSRLTSFTEWKSRERMHLLPSSSSLSDTALRDSTSVVFLILVKEQEIERHEKLLQYSLSHPIELELQ